MRALHARTKDPLEVLLDIYAERKDLQAAYPEAGAGDYRRLLEWASGVARGSWADTAYATLRPHASRFEHSAGTGEAHRGIKGRTLEFARRNLRNRWLRNAAKRLGANSGGASGLRTAGEPGSKSAPADLAAAKDRKQERIRPLLRSDMPHVVADGCIDFLTPELREQFNIVDTSAVSSNEYDEHAAALIGKHRDGLILDCGAGRRSVYFDNVVNFEIVAYDTTDVRGVGEVLPFRDNSFDAVFSLAVLEHVKDPFACAKEIIRVLKPGADLMCCVPFLQPLHGYPHHYYNMSGQGLKNLFSPHIEVDRHEVYHSVLPIWSLTWILSSWAAGLNGRTKEEFLKLRVSDLLESGGKYLDCPFVTELSAEKNFELASATVLFGHKKS